MNISDQQAAASSSAAVGDHMNINEEPEDPHLNERLVSNISVHTTDGSSYHESRKVRAGIAIASIEAIIMLGLVVIAFVLPHVLDNTSSASVHVNSYTITLYSHSGVWFIIFIFEHLFNKHHRKLKYCGYIRFYRSISYLQRHPLYVKSFAQAIYLVLNTYISACKSNAADGICKLFTLTPIMCLQIITSIEAAVMLVGLVMYIGRVHLHNKYTMSPDGADEQMLQSFQAHSINSGPGVGYRSDSYMDDIIENQADKIRALQDQNAKLSRKLYSLSVNASNTTYK